ncbi:MAG: homoserine O-acetyltransferase [Saprospiraceae bacterium]|nr:homoserine O-acetyltransferase [Saprospiraceae bacterium]
MHAGEHHTFIYNNNFSLESGEQLSGFKLAYHTFGRLNKKKDNVVWIIHALTANSNPLEWWPGIVGKGCAIDPDDHFIVCVNSIGSPYGSTSPLSVNPETTKPYFHTFPMITNRDIVRSFELLSIYLGLDKIKLLAGASLGGQQALEWSIMSSTKFENMLLIATNAKHSPWGIGFNESQRLAIKADQTWLENREDAGQAGLLAARSIALLSYRSPQGYNNTQADDQEKLDNFRVLSYQKYQGEKLVKRFNAFSYVVLTKAMDSHNVGRSRGGLLSALSTIKAKTTLLGIETDLLFPPDEQKFLYTHIPNARFEMIHSDLGHDGFLTENAKVGHVIDGILG